MAYWPLSVGGAFLLLSVCTGLAASPEQPAGGGVKYPVDMSLPHKSRSNTAEIQSAILSDDVTPQQAAVEAFIEDLGQGYNSFARRKTGDCVDGRIIGPKPTSFNPEYTLRLVRSSADLHEELSAEASISGNFEAWSASASTKVSTDLTRNSVDDFLLIKVRVTADPPIKLNHLKPTEKPANASPQAQAEFFRDCGDSFIRVAQMGGEFLALLSYKSENEEQHRNFEANFSVETLSVKGDASVMAKVASARKNLQLAVQATRIGGSGIFEDTNIDALLRYSLEFPKTLNAENVAYIGFDTDAYQPLRVNVPDYQEAMQRFGSLRKSLADRQGFAETLERIKVEQRRLGLDDVYAPVRTRIHGEIQESERLVSTCANSPLTCKVPENLSGFTAPEDVFRPQIVSIPVTDGNFTGAFHTGTAARLKIVGRICFHNDGMCAEANSGAVEVTINNAKTVYRQEINIPTPPGNRTTTITYHLVDSDYGDNTGSLKAILY